MGGCVKQGEKGYLVVFWKFFTSGKPSESDSVDETSLKEKSFPMLRYYTVFNVAQTTIPADKLPPAPPMNTIDPIVQCDSLIANMPKRPEIKTGEAKAFYAPVLDVVNMPVKGLFNSTNDYYATLFHELGHSTGHETRLNRAGIASDRHGFGSKSYSREELVAEMTSAFLCGSCGIDNTLGQSAAYIQNWINALREDKRCVVVAASQAQKAADFIQGKEIIHN
jgi:antirestriction protein ArdC